MKNIHGNKLQKDLMVFYIEENIKIEIYALKRFWSNTIK